MNKKLHEKYKNGYFNKNSKLNRNFNSFKADKEFFSKSKNKNKTKVTFWSMVGDGMMWFLGGFALGKYILGPALIIYFWWEKRCRIA